MERTARGGMADVYRAHDLRLERDVAIKIIRAGSPEIARFRAEAGLLGTLQHDHLVRLFDAGEHTGLPFVVLEWCDQTLAQLMASKPLPPSQAAEIGTGLALALAWFHEAGAVHRDIKPANVLLTSDGRAVLGDLGIALSADGERLTATGLSLGTPQYLAPEQAASSSVGPAADVYSLGVVLIEALTGHPPFAGSPKDVLAAKLVHTPTIPEHLPNPWRLLLQLMTALEPDQRPTAAEAAFQLRQLAAPPETVTAPLRALPPKDLVPRRRPDKKSSSPVRSPARRSHRRRVATAIAAGAIVVLTSLLLVQTLGRPEPTSSNPTATSSPPAPPPSQASTPQANRGVGARATTTTATSTASSITTTATPEATALPTTSAAVATTTASTTTSSTPEPPPTTSPTPTTSAAPASPSTTVADGLLSRGRPDR